MLLSIEAQDAAELRVKVLDLARTFGAHVPEDNQMPLFVDKALVNKLPAAASMGQFTNGKDLHGEIATDDETPPAAETAKIRKSRKPKEVASQDSVPAQTPAVTVTTTTLESAKPLTKEDVRVALTSVTSSKGFDIGKLVLSNFKTPQGEDCSRLSDLQEKDYAAFVSLCKTTAV